MADSTPDLATLARAAKATMTEPWAVEPRANANHDWEPQYGYDVRGIEQPDIRGMFAHRAVAEFVAAANPDAILALLAERDALKAIAFPGTCTHDWEYFNSGGGHPQMRWRTCTKCQTKHWLS